MKKIVLLAVVLVVLCAGSAFAKSPLGYIGLFADGDHSTWCVTGTGFYPVDMWVWCHANFELGTICSEFMVAYPPIVIQSTVTWNDPIISVSLGDLPSGLSVCYDPCQWNWFWICHQLCYVTDPTQTNIEIVPHPDTGEYSFANCDEGYPMEPVVKFTNLMLNLPQTDAGCLTATKSASWGAIKSMIE